MNISLSGHTTVRNSDMLTLVDVDDNKAVKPHEVGAYASYALNERDISFPNYPVDGAGIILIFRTARESFVLGGVRSNPALKEKFTKDGTFFPQQINSTIGGGLQGQGPEMSLRDAVINVLSKKMFLNSPIAEEGIEAQNALKGLRSIIQEDTNWAKEVCVHTDKWKEKDGDRTMCYLTTVKFVTCDEDYLTKISAALAQIMAVKKKDENVKPWELTEYKFVPLVPLVQNSIASHQMSELEKANEAYDIYGDSITVTFNDLCVATLAKANVFTF